ncbi:uncharacterized protein ACO6RY_03148 [Pungitius sinensis]
MTDRRWPRLPRCCGAQLSPSATSRRAQQRLHRCNFDDGFFFFLETSMSAFEVPFW